MRYEKRIPRFHPACGPWAAARVLCNGRTRPGHPGRLGSGTAAVTPRALPASAPLSVGRTGRFFSVSANLTDSTIAPGMGNVKGGICMWSVLLRILSREIRHSRSGGWPVWGPAPHFFYRSNTLWGLVPRPGHFPGSLALPIEGRTHRSAPTLPLRAAASPLQGLSPSVSHECPASGRRCGTEPAPYNKSANRTLPFAGKI